MTMLPLADWLIFGSIAYKSGGSGNASQPCHPTFSILHLSDALLTHLSLAKTTNLSSCCPMLVFVSIVSSCHGTPFSNRITPRPVKERYAGISRERDSASFVPYFVNCRSLAFNSEV